MQSNDLIVPIVAIVAVVSMALTVLNSDRSEPSFQDIELESSAGQAIAGAEYCGNGVCASSETCSTCSKDCGSCPSTPSTVQFALGPTFLSLFDNPSDAAPGSVTIHNENIEDAMITAKGTPKLTNAYLLNDLTYILTSDAATKIDIYLSPGDKFKQNLDEPWGMLGSWDILFSAFNNSTTSSLVQLQTYGQPYKVTSSYPISFNRLNTALGIIKPGPLTKQALPVLLAPTTLGTTAVSQELWLSTNSGMVQFTENNYDVDGYFLFYDDGLPIFTYKMTFSPALYLTTSTPASLLGANVNLLGGAYTIVRAQGNSQGVSLDMMEKGITDTLAEGATKKYTVNGKVYDVTLLVVDSNTKTAKLLINGEVTDALYSGSTDTLADGMQVAVISMQAKTSSTPGLY